LVLALPIYLFSKNSSIFFFLKNAGPSFIKLGQVLSTRPDLIGEDLSLVLSSFQDKLPPFSTKKLRIILGKEFGKRFEEIFLEFDFTPVASASIAQVHKAKLKNGRAVAVKVLRPNIDRIITRDVSTLKLLSKLFFPFSKFFTKTFQDIANLLEQVAKNEVDLLAEAANASKLRQNLSDLNYIFL
jgi:ubiquinone biosynthesis protein